MLSFIRIEKVEDQFAFCELEMRWVSESKSIGLAPARYEHVYVLLDKFHKFGKIEEGEVFIFKVEESENEDEEDKFIPLEDEALMDAVFEEYLRVAEAEGCGCGCDDCEHHDHCHDDDCDCE